MSIKIAVVGATGNVGREILNILDERMFPCDEVVALASRKSMGRELSYGDKTLKVKNLETYDFSDEPAQGFGNHRTLKEISRTLNLGDPKNKL